MSERETLSDPLHISEMGQTPPDEDHPERASVGATGGLGGGEAMGSSTHPTTAGTKAEEPRRAEPWRGSAAPEHDVGAAPGMAPAGPHGWPLSTGGAPTVTGGESIQERDLPSSGGQSEGEAPELGLDDEP